MRDQGRHRPKHRQERMTYGLVDGSDAIHILGAHLLAGSAFGVFWFLLLLVKGGQC